MDESDVVGRSEEPMAMVCGLSMMRPQGEGDYEGKGPGNRGGRWVGDYGRYCTEKLRGSGGNVTRHTSHTRHVVLSRAGTRVKLLSFQPGPTWAARRR